MSLSKPLPREELGVRGVTAVEVPLLAIFTEHVPCLLLLTGFSVLN